MSKVARQIHSIPATGAGIVRQFSVAGVKLSDRSTCLGPEQLDSILRTRAIAKVAKEKQRRLWSWNLLFPLEFG